MAPQRIDTVDAIELPQNISQRINALIKAVSTNGVPDALSLVPGLIPSASAPVEMAWLGDSRTDQGSYIAPNRLMSNGPQFWTEFHSGGRVRNPLDLNFGVAGQTSTTIRDRTYVVAACRAPIVHVCCGTNDLAGTDTFGNIIQIIKTLRDANKVVIVTPELPRTVGIDAERISRITSIRTRMLNLNQFGVYVVDPWPYFVDPDATDGAVNAGIYHDNLHLTNLGGYYWGRAIADIITKIVPPTNVLAVTPADAYHATNNPWGILNTNPLVYGTGGTVSAGATGTTPTGGDTRRVGADITVTSAAGVVSSGKKWHQITVGGTATTASQAGVARWPIDLGNLTPGDVIEAACEVEVDAGRTGARGPALELLASTGSVDSSYANYDTSGSAFGIGPAFAYSGVMRTPRLVVASGLSTLFAQINIRAENGNAAAAVVRYRALSVRKIF